MHGRNSVFSVAHRMSLLFEDFNYLLCFQIMIHGRTPAYFVVYLSYFVVYLSYFCGVFVLFCDVFVMGLHVSTFHVHVHMCMPECL